jgi:hypothetical protein
VGPRELKMDPNKSKTYIMVWFKVWKNFNGRFANRRIVMAYLRNAIVVIAYTQ